MYIEIFIDNKLYSVIIYLIEEDFLYGEIKSILYRL